MSAFLQLWLTEEASVALILSLQLASLTTLLLLTVCVPLCWWLTRRGPVSNLLFSSVSLLPLVMPPSVLGFYLLWFLRPDSLAGSLWSDLMGSPFAFSFAGLVLASCLYSLPFAIQPCLLSFRSLNADSLRLARLLGVSRYRVLTKLWLPQVRSGIVAAAALSFAHTLGEFGILLMIGGAVPGVTKVVSIEIFERTERLDFGGASEISITLIVIAVVAVVASQLALRGSYTGRQD